MMSRSPTQPSTRREPLTVKNAVEMRFFADQSHRLAQIGPSFFRKHGHFSLFPPLLYVVAGSLAVGRFGDGMKP